MRHRILSPILALSVAALALTATAQEKDPASIWANVNHLAPGSEIRVVLAAGRTLHGFLQSASADSLAINAATSQETLSRQDIARVQLKRPGHRGRNTLIGLSVGAAGGLATGAALDAKTNASWDLFPNAGKVVFTPLGALIGTVVGVAIPTGGWREIYRAPPSRSSP